MQLILSLKSLEKKWKSILMNLNPSAHQFKMVLEGLTYPAVTMTLICWSTQLLSR